MFLDDENKNLEENPEVEDETEEVVEDGIVSGLVDVDTVGLVKESFLDYAMSVIVARALPDIRDGMKPVHRRIVYSLFETGTTPDKPFKKCARIVGDVMGKYHPHGDSAIYGALARLAQPFSMRYTLVEGHGNFGNIDGDEPAAYRYTEARMAKLALEMVRDINCNTVDFVDNYDGVDQEPTVLPSRFPNLLVNGSSGIAVGMATNIPPHNLKEIIDGVNAVAKNPEISTEELLNYVKGPDFPSGATILGRRGIFDAYDTGTGTVVIRSKCRIESRGNSGDLKRIVVEEIPYGVNKATMVENIATLARDKVIDGITDIRDESNKEGIRIVIEVRRDVVPEVLLNQLYKLTSLQSSFGIINLCLVDGAPKVCSLRTMLQEYLNFQIEVVARRTRFLLKKDEDRKHIVEGLILCHDNIDEIVDMIKSSSTPEEATSRLMERFGFSDPQVQAILGMNLRRLTGIENEKLEAEKVQLEANIVSYNHILESRENQCEVVLNELNEIKEKFGDERRTDISDAEASIDDEDLIPEEQIVITLSRGGYVKRMSADSFKAQHRGGRGIRGASLNDNDHVEFMMYTKTHTDLLFFTDLGKVYRLRGYQIPEYQRTGKGVPVINLINIEKGETVKAVIDCEDYTDKNHYLMFFTEGGVIKKTHISEYESIRQNGKIALGLKEGDMVLDVKHIYEGTDENGNAIDTICGIAASNGRMCNFHSTETREMGRTASGVKGIDLDEGDKVVGVTTSLDGDKILVLTEKGFGKMTPVFEEDDGRPLEERRNYRLTKRGAKGVSTLKATPKIGKLVCVKAVNGDEDLLVITNHGILIRTPISEIRLSSRNTQGVKILNMEDKSKVASIAVVPHEEIDESAISEEDINEESVEENE